jgi:hypothetical protein
LVFFWAVRLNRYQVVFELNPVLDPSKIEKSRRSDAIGVVEQSFDDLAHTLFTDTGESFAPDCALATRYLRRFRQHTFDGASDSNRSMPDVTGIRRGDRGRLEPFDDEVDPERQLPQELRDRRDGGRQGDLLVGPEQHGDKRRNEQRTAMFKAAKDAR